jgi:hypothetical protein
MFNRDRVLMFVLVLLSLSIFYASYNASKLTLKTEISTAINYIVITATRTTLTVSALTSVTVRTTVKSTVITTSNPSASMGVSP